MSEKLESFLVKDGGRFELYFCRGEGKCTKKPSEKMRMSRLKKRCSDCVRGNDDETLEQLQARLNRGDA